MAQRFEQWSLQWEIRNFSVGKPAFHSKRHRLIEIPSHFYYFKRNTYFNGKNKFQSSGVADALFFSKWCDESKEIKNMILVVMMRSTRILCFEIGPFNIMSLNTLIMVNEAFKSFS